MREFASQALFREERVLLHELNHRINNEFASAISIVSRATAERLFQRSIPWVEVLCGAISANAALLAEARTRPFSARFLRRWKRPVSARSQNHRAEPGFIFTHNVCRL
jgi:two-component sensor histidine kinase